MDLCAELTLRLIRIGQEALGPMASMVEWTFFPELRRASWIEARDILTSAPKPVLVAALVEPGAIVLWSRNSLSESGRAALESRTRNQCAFYDGKLSAFGLDANDEIETPDGEFRLSVAEFRRWAREYSMSVVGVGMDPGQTPHTARLLVRPPGGSRAPIGWIEPGARTADADQ